VGLGRGFDLLHVLRPEPSRCGPFEFSSLLLARRIARAVRGRRYDAVDVPSFYPFLHLLRRAFAQEGVEVGAWVLALHGWNSVSVRGDWSRTRTEEELRELERLEEACLAEADVRYGISSLHLRECEARVALPTTLLDPWCILDRPAPLPAPPPGGPPDLWFVGRIEKLKGPDLFVALAAALPRSRYGGVYLAGPDGVTGGRTWWSHVQEVAAQHGVEAAFVGSLPHAELERRVFGGRCVAFFPSRADTFNLAVVEALLRGCPSLVSRRMGVHEFLRGALPDVPFVSFDPEAPSAAAEALGGLLARYDEERARLVEALRAAPFPAPREDFLGEVYAAPAVHDAAARARTDAHWDAVTRPFRGWTLRWTAQRLGWVASRLVARARHHGAAAVRRLSGTEDRAG